MAPFLLCITLPRFTISTTFVSPCHAINMKPFLQRYYAKLRATLNTKSGSRKSVRCLFIFSQHLVSLTHLCICVRAAAFTCGLPSAQLLWNILSGVCMLFLHQFVQNAFGEPRIYAHNQFESLRNRNTNITKTFNESIFLFFVTPNYSLSIYVYLLEIGKILFINWGEGGKKNSQKPGVLAMLWVTLAGRYYCFTVRAVCLVLAHTFGHVHQTSCQLDHT